MALSEIAVIQRTFMVAFVGYGHIVLSRCAAGPNELFMVVGALSL